MPNDQKLPERRRNDQRLNSWKAIGAYFERDERTVKRWEAQRGLPVHRVPGAGRSGVYACTSELAEWLKTADTHTPLTTAGDDPPSESSIAAVATPPAVDSSDRSPRRTRMIISLAVAVLVFSVVSFATYRQLRLGHAALASARPAGLKAAANPEAEELYLQGLYHWNKRTPENLNLALDDFTQSIVHDPNYAPAYAGMANCYNLMREYTLMPAKEAYPRAMAAAKRAIALDDSLAEAHNALAFGDFYWSWDAASAEQEFQRAIALDPHSVAAHHWYATFLMVLGRAQEALAEIEEARKLDPQSSAILADKGLILFAAGQESQSVELLKQIEATDPAFLSPHAYLATVYLEMKNFREYLPEAKQTAELLHDQNRMKIVTAAEEGFAANEGDGMLRAMLSVEKELYNERQFDAYDLATTYCLLGEKKQALSLLKVAVANHDERDVALRIDENFAALHDEPEFRAMLEQVGLPGLE